MHILTASRQEVELDLLSSSLVADPAGRLIVNVGSETASPAVTGGARAFFAMGVQRGAVRAQSPLGGPPPCVFRERPPRCRILAVKVFHADDLASDARVANAIRYAALHADILSCSWSGGQSPDIELAIEDAGAMGRGGKGAAVFCAAGNDYGAPVAFPASHADAVAVGASTDRATLADYSNVGPELWLVAPSSGGVRGIFTTDVSIQGRGFNVGDAGAGGSDGLHTNDFGGTSSATPLAAGVAALVLSHKPDLDRAALKDILAKTADHIGAGYDANGHSPRFGHGRVNAARALSAV